MPKMKPETAILKRLAVRFADEPRPPSTELQGEYVRTAVDRVCIRTGRYPLPDAAQSLVVEVVVKMWRRRFYEGVSSESDGEVSSSFVDDVLDEHAAELDAIANGSVGRDGAVSRPLLRFR